MCLPFLFSFMCLACSVLTLMSESKEKISSKCSKEDNLQIEFAICPWLRHTKASFPGENVGLRVLLKQQPQIETQSPEYTPKEAR